jgi:hypothetical protein
MSNSMIFIAHIKTESRGWVPLAKTPAAPYVFDSARDAWRMADICCPDQCRSMRLGGDEVIRVTALSPDRFRQLFPSLPTPELPQLLEAAR